MSFPDKINPSRPPRHHNETLLHSQNFSTSPTNIDNDITLYNTLVNQDNTTEDVVKIGELIQESINKTLEQRNPEQVVTEVTPARHTGNWKTSLLFNTSRLLAHLFSATVQPVRPTRPTQFTFRPHAEKTKASSVTKYANSTRDNVAFPTTSTLLASTSKHSRSSVSKAKKTPKKQFSRKKRTVDAENKVEVIKYDLTDENIIVKLGLTPTQIDSCPKAINNLKKAINRYNSLRNNKNSRTGQSLLVKQSEFLEQIQTKLKLSDTHKSFEVMSMIKAEYKSHRVPVEKLVHGIWVAGSPPEGTEAYIKTFLQAYDDFKFYLWVDDSAYGAAKFSSIMKKNAFDVAISKLKESIPESHQQFIKQYNDLRKEYDNTQNPKLQKQYLKDIQAMRESYEALNKSIKNTFNALLLKETVVQQDHFFNFCLLKGLNSISDETRIEFLTKEMSLPKEEISEYRKLIENNKRKIQKLVDTVNADLKKTRVFIKDIKELDAMSNRINQYNYNMEMLLRWNYAAATDQTRMYMLLEHGGIYTDLDMMPAYSSAINKQIYDVGGDSFFEDLSIRRAISGITLKLVNENSQSLSLQDIAQEVDLSKISEENQQKLSTLIDNLKSFAQAHDGKSFFERMDSSIIRDTMPILQRYHKWSTGWNVRGLNGLMMSHKGSSTVEAVIRAQQQAYEHQKTLRQNVVSREFFDSLQELSEFDAMAVIGGELVKDYLGGSLFYNFRQDSITPGAVSTLGISGPDLIMRTMKKFFREQGPIGKDFLENGGRKLGKNVFLGAYREKPKEGAKQERGVESITFDWLNPLTVGANDVTPADESTWCGIKSRDAGDLLFSDPVKINTKPLKFVSKTKVNIKEFTESWSDSAKSVCPEDLLQRFNKIIAGPSFDIGEISELDVALTLAKRQMSDDKIAQEAVFSLQLQLAELVRSTQFPVSNSVSFVLDARSNFESDLSKAVKLYLKADLQTTINLWTSSLGNKVLFLKDMLSVSERILAISNFIDSVDETVPSLKEIDLLTAYSELKAKESFDLLSSQEVDKFLEISTQIAENPRLQNKINEIEYNIDSGYLYKYHEKLLTSYLSLSDSDFKKKVLIFAKNLSKDNSLTKQDQKKQNSWYEEICNKIYERRVANPVSKMQDFMKNFEGNNRVVVRDLDVYLAGHPLFEKIQKNGYAFQDFQTLGQLILANSGVSGILSTHPVFPAPSRLLVDVVKSKLEDDYDKMNEAMSLVYDLLASEKNGKERKQIYESLEAAGLEMLGEMLSPYTPQQLLVPPSDNSVTALGRRYGIEHGRETEQVVVNLAPGIFNPAGYTMERYLEALYEIHREIHEGSLTEETAQTILRDKDSACFINREGIQALLQYAASRYYCSLTEVHRILTNQFFLAEATGSLLSGAFPGIDQITSVDQSLNRPRVTAITESPAVNPYDYRGVGLNENVFFTPREIPSVTSVVEGAKYTASSWREFFDTHVEHWSDLAVRLGSKLIETHPQTFLFEAQGRCMGLSMMYMLAEDIESYKLIQNNLMTVSALYQENKRDGLLLSGSDQDLVDRSTTLIDWLQLRGNKFLSHKEVFSTESWGLFTLKKQFEEKLVKSVLITTPSHSVVLQKLGDNIYRLTDPNFGHIDFTSVEQVFYFVVGIVEESYEIKRRYGFSDYISVREQIKIHTPNGHKFENTLFAGTDLGLTSQHQSTTLERITEKGSVTINQIKTSWRVLYQIGGIVDHKRVSETTTKEDLSRLKIHGDVLNDYLSKNVLDSDTSSLIRTILKTYGLESGTKPVEGRAIVDTPNEVVSLVQTSKRRMAKMKSSLQAMLKLISNKLRSISVSDKDQAKIKSASISDDDLLTMEIEISDKQTKTITFDGEGLAVSFKRVGRMLNELSSTGVLDLDLGMSVVSLVQYARMVEQGQSTDALAQFNLALDVKAMSELTLGSAIQVMGKKFLTDSGVNTLSLESVLASRLHTAARKIGGSTGRALLGAAKVLELPILEAVAGVWNLYSSIEVLTRETSHSEQMAARVQVAFDAISLALTLSATVAPSLMLAAGPVAAIGMGAAAIAQNVAYHESRHEAWLRYKDFLEQGSKNIVVSFPERGIIDLSGNGVLGDVCLDLRNNSPLLTGKHSYNANRWIGHQPGLSDRQVREKLSYAYSISPERALAKGHANSRWPQNIPSIPPGNYHTVIVGYGIQYEAVTEVIYLSNQVAWREAVMETDSLYYKPPLTAISQQTTIIAGDEPLTVLPVRLLDGDSKKERNTQDENTAEDEGATEDEDARDDLRRRVEQAKLYKDYKIIVKGGSGGVIVQVGGAGIYDLEGDPRANNTISFRAIPAPYYAAFNLKEKEYQEIRLVERVGKNEYKITKILKVRQSNFNTIVGSASEHDYLSGNHDTTFFLSPMGATIYSGSGSCRYDVPDISGCIMIFLEDNSVQHSITLHQTVFDIVAKPPFEKHYIPMALLLLILSKKPKPNPFVSGLYMGYPWDSSTEDYEKWVDNVVVSLDDGIELRAMKTQEEALVFGITNCNHLKWQQAHPEEAGYPEDILETLRRSELPFNKTFTIVRKDSSIVFDFEDQKFIYYPKPYAQISVRTSSQYDVVVAGEEGCGYIIKSLPGIESRNITIQLKGSVSIGAILDFYSLVISSIEGRLPSDSNNTMELTISSPRYRIPLTLTWPGEVPRSTFIEVTDRVHGNLGKWYDILNQNRGSTQSLYRRSMLAADRIESVGNLDDTVTLLEPEKENNSLVHILGIENKEETEVQIKGNMYSGTFTGSMENLRWTTTKPSKIFEIIVPPRNIKYLSFQRGRKSENIVFYSTIKPSIIEAKKQPMSLISKDQWGACSQINVYYTSLTLGDFRRYRINDETDALSRQLMYAQGLVKIYEQDLIATFFYIRGGRGVGSVILKFKEFFNMSIGENRDSYKNLNEHVPLINTKYRDHLDLTLGSERLNLAILVSEFLETHHVTSLQRHKNVPYQLEFPQNTLRFPNTNIFSYTINPNTTNTSKNDFNWLPVDTSIKKYELPGLAVRGASLYLDPVSGNLFLTRINRFGSVGTEALLIKFPNYKCKWREFQKMMILERNLLTVLNSETISRSGITFFGPSVQRIRFDDMNWMRGFSRQASVVSIEADVHSKKNQVVHLDLVEGRKYHSFLDLYAGDLRDRFNQSAEARTYDNYLLAEALHLCEEKQEWKVSKDMLSEGVGYYSQVSSTWVQKEVKENTRLTLLANTEMSLITSQGVMFTRQQERSGFLIHYRVMGLDKVIDDVELSTQTPGALRCSLKTNATMVVRRVDNSQYSNRNIFIVAEIVSKEEKDKS
ncbi:LifA/Efa1-related large cytotoxin [Chlamydiifrater volucris]|uniref:LifA/Efa1-related large cytotoxin n=1 Tax=Chlamydiifrater volucris TaxID=2681470 RepID=UPI001BCBFC0C|nr:LifA/Efa1-related large cytotoxin [Chlamydiifrater volucris]